MGTVSSRRVFARGFLTGCWALLIIRTTLFFGERSDEKGPPKIFFSPTSGLGNSILALVSTAQLARSINAPFGISWDTDTSPSCQASYDDIFQRTLSSAGDLGDCKRKCKLDLTQSGARSCWKVLACDERIKIAQLFASCDCVHVSSNQFFMPIYSSHVVNDLSSLAKQYLKPSKRLEHRMYRSQEYWKKEFGVTHVIGIHVRAAHSNSGSRDGKWIPKKRTFERVFWPCLQKVVREVHARSETIGVFVAADMPEVRIEATELLGTDERVVELPTPLKALPNDTGLGPQRSSVEVQDAALELFLLLNSDSLLVKRGMHFDSTFSASAMALARCGSATSCYYVEQEKCELVTGQVTPDFHLQGKISCEIGVGEEEEDCDLL
mmetsp:Transcript_13579/g.59278  ORF Transcript_13579/g.59278 Transcript_13579/m.59278 type:complete len:380 (+) Transcript_13579:34-1173(+)